MIQTNRVNDLEALRARYGDFSGKDTVTLPARPQAESYVGRVIETVKDHPRLATMGAAVAGVCVATRTNPVCWLRDRVHTASMTVAGAAVGAAGTWIAMHTGADALASVAQMAHIGTGLFDTAVGATIIGVGGWAGRSVARYNIAQREASKPQSQTAASTASLGRATTLILAGAALPHIVSKIKNH